MSGMITADTSQLDKLAESLKNWPEESVKAMHRVLSRSKTTVQAKIPQLTSKVYGVSSGQVREALLGGRRRLKTIMGAAGEGSISFEVVGRPLTLSRFKHTPGKPPQNNNKKKLTKKKDVQKLRPYQLRVTVRLDSSQLIVRPTRGNDQKLKSAFLMPAKRAGGESAFLITRRTGIHKNGRETLHVMRSLSIPQMIGHPDVQGPLIEAVNKTLLNRTEIELSNASNKIIASSFGGPK